jgi:translocation and assembly module TamB
LTRILAALALLIFALPALAQDTAEEERSFFISFVEDQLSTPDRQIRISGIRGVLSSNATIGEITVADREGVWLRIVNASIDWNRSALLRSRVDINTLAAERIEVLRRPLPAEGLPSPEARSFQIPQLPLAIIIGALEVPNVAFGADVFGLESELAVTGRMNLEGGSLDTALEIERLDGPGGQFTLTATYANETEVFDLDVTLSEPENGIVANLLNIEGRPPILLTLAGEGPIGDLNLALTLDAASRRLLTGTTELRRQAEGLAFSANVEGPIAELIPAQFRAFFGAETTLATSGVVKDEGGLLLEAINLRSAALTLEGAAETGADGFLRRLMLDAAIADPSANRVILPVPGGETTVEQANLSIAFGDTAGEEWSGRLDITGLTTDTLVARSVALTLGGLAQNIDRPAERRITFNADGAVSGITAERTDVAEALGEEITLDVDGVWQAGTPVVLQRALVTGQNLSVSLAGDIAEFAFNGDLSIEASSLAPFSGLAGRDLTGGIELEATGQIAPVSGAFNLRLDGAVTDLTIDEPIANGLLGGTTAITGRLARTTQGFNTEALRIANEQITLTAGGSFATGAADFSFDFALADLALIAEQASGRLTSTGRASGSDGLINLTFAAGVPNGSLAGKRLSEGSLVFEGMLQQGNVDGQVTGSAFLDGVRAELTSAISITDQVRRLSDLRFTAGGATVTGGLTQIPTGLYTGTLSIRAPNIETAAALFLREATGAIEADLTLEAEEGRQNADVRASVGNFRTEGITIGKGRIEARIEDLFNVPMIQGTLDATSLFAAGIDVSQIRATADRAGETTNFSANAALANGATASARGALTPEQGGYRLSLESAELARGTLSARLLEPTNLLVQGRNVIIGGLNLDVGGGRVAVSGDIADTLNLDASITDLPLAIANAVRPDLELSGRLNGTAKAAGTRERPDIRFDLRGDTISAAALRRAGLQSISVDATGTSSGNRLTVNAGIASPEGVRATVRGGVPLGEGALALDIDLSAFPLTTLNAVAPGQNLTGRITGSARVTGALDDPAASFQLSGTGVSATPLASAGIGPLELRATGRYADSVIALTSANAGGPQGLSLSASGRMPITGAGLDVRLTGQAPLSLANRFLAERGARVSGALALNAAVSGSLRQPAVNGTFSTSGADFVDPETGLRLRNISVSANIANDTVSLTSASAALAAGGTVGAAGTISIRPDAGFPADLRITLSQARYADGELVVATVTGGLTLTGPLARDPLLSGNINVERAEITVPERLGGGAAGIDVIHVDPPPEVARTLQRARTASDGTPMPSSRPSVLRLNVAVNAPNRIFVRGRGLDVELGGQVTITGPITSVQPVGGFRIIRGRLSILGQRITFDEGMVTLVGDLDPFLNFVARSERSDITVLITVAGRVSDPDISFSSQPELPEDEVLARLIFNRGMGELSPLQIAQLGLAAAELAGGSNTSLLGSLRQATGLDDIDVVTTPEGGTAVRVGRYIQDNVYLGVEAGTQGSTRATINLDITQDLKAKGSFGTNGDSSLGVFFEKDY